MILTGDISRRMKKYDTEEERQRAKLMSDGASVKPVLDVYFCPGAVKST